MKKSSFLFISALFATQARAQILPAPAPQPVMPQSSAPTKPSSKPAPQVAAPDPFVIENPPSTDAPIVIGEPVRHQSTAKPTPTSPLATPKPKASVAGVSIAGQSDRAAVATLRAALLPELKKPVRLVIGDYQYTFLREELGASVPVWPLMRQARKVGGDVPFHLQVDEAKLLAALRELDAQVRQDFEKTGLNVGASATRVKIALEAAPVPASVVLETQLIENAAPETEKAAPEKPEPGQIKETKPGKYGFLLASFATHYDASLRGRTTNLKMAAKHIDGTIVPPGRVFSANAAIGPRDAASGWREAKMFVSGQVVSGTGAGICQAASTLYNAALLGNFPIVERHAHSMRVMYVPPSRDAALMWGSKDFKFRNTTDSPLRVQTWVAGGKFHVNLWSQKPRQSAPVQIVSHVLSRAGGTKSEAFKIVGDQKIRLSRDSYKPHP